MRVLLISPNTLKIPYPVYPIGLDYVAGSLDPRHQVRVADMNLVSLEELAALVADFSPQITGISCRNVDNTDAADVHSFIRDCRKLIDWLRDRSTSLVVCGGSGFTIMPDEVFPALNADYGIIGEGERFGLLVDALEKGRDPLEIPGVIDRAGATELPPPWTGTGKRLFQPEIGDYYQQHGGMLNLQTKRGCSFQCIYCPYPRIEGGKHRLNRPDEVAATAKQLEDAGAEYIFITDSAFNSDVEHSLAVARAFKKHGLSIAWGGFFAPIPLPGDYFDILSDCGLKHAEFGTEAMSATMLATYRKPFTVEDVFQAHGMARRAGVHTAHYFLLGGPGESEETVTESLDRIEQLDRAALFFFIGIRIYPRTKLHAMAVRRGRIEQNRKMLDPVFYRPRAIGLGEIENLVSRRAAGRMNWIVGAGGEKSAAIVKKMHARGRSGPLWEHLAR